MKSALLDPEPRYCGITKQRGLHLSLLLRAELVVWSKPLLITFLFNNGLSIPVCTRVRLASENIPLLFLYTSTLIPSFMGQTLA